MTFVHEEEKINEQLVKWATFLFILIILLLIIIIRLFYLCTSLHLPQHPHLHPLHPQVPFSRETRATFFLIEFASVESSLSKEEIKKSK